MKRIIVILIIAVMASVAAAAQGAPSSPSSTPPAPVVSETQRLQLQNLALRIENAQLRARQAEVDHAQAQQEATALVKSMQRDGYTLDLQTLTYIKTEAPKPAAITPPK